MSAENFQNLTYDQLFLYIQQYLMRTDDQTLANIPNWINLAEKQLAIRLRNLGNVEVVTIQMEPNQQLLHSAGILVAKPSLWHSTKSFSVVVNGIRTYLLPRTYEYLQQLLNDYDGLEPPLIDDPFPRYYCDYNQTQWLLGPYVNDAPIELEISYYQQLSPLSSQNQQNFWTRYAPAALIYGVLCEACNFLRSDDRLGVFQPKYEAAINELLGEGAARVNDNSITRSNS